MSSSNPYDNDAHAIDEDDLIDPDDGNKTTYSLIDIMKPTPVQTSQTSMIHYNNLLTIALLLLAISNEMAHSINDT